MKYNNKGYVKVLKDKKNYKVKPLVFIIAGIAVLVLIAAAITAGVISEHNKSKENTVGMTLTQKNLRPQDAEADNNEVKEITTVEILMDDTAIPVGTTFMAAAIARNQQIQIRRLYGQAVTTM